jgi:hypothetical protein
LALLAFVALNVAVPIWLPNEAAVRLPWLVPSIECVLLVALLTGDPARRAARRLRARRRPGGQRVRLTSSGGQRLGDYMPIAWYPAST